MEKTKKLGDLVNQTVTLSAPLSGTANLTDTLNFSITKANTTTDGYVSKEDWNFFNNKEDALGFTPYNSTNPDGFISGITSGMVTTALGFTPYDSANPSGYITSSALTGLVPYTGATANVNLGTRTLTTPTIIGVSGVLNIDSTTRVAINYPSLPAIYKLGVGGKTVIGGEIVIQDDSGNFSAYSSDGSIQSGGFSFNRYVGVNIYSSNTNPIKLSVNGSENFRMFNGGNILIQNGGTFTNNGFRLDINGTGRFQNTLTLATGTTTLAPLKLTAGTNLTTPINGSFEFDGTNLYFTVGGIRKTVTLI